jgi:mono/diheme cytochrome c family protein
MVTEVPDYLLQRSRERRAALGLGGGDPGAGGSAVDAGGGDAGAAPATTSAASSTPAVAAPQPIAPGTPDPTPQPDPPNVVAARSRKKVPLWALPVLALLPLWGYAYAGTLEPPTSDELTAQQAGGEVYSNCASCHGGGGEGGAGPAFDSVGETFPDPTDHAHWVFLGSTGWGSEVGDTYGANDKPVNGGMPAWGTALTPEELMEVIIYERAEFGGLDVEAEGLVDEEGNLLVTYDEEQGVLVDIATGEPAEITPEG